ncbi:fam-a protein [Plasmodium vinckei petteri]|uniref:Fam-a protein n=1 Tax=Plasmodium vinckei petteri TaxID=138298 RepID=A0A6V7TC50_PLAVN|nr:fam-a protein [Plasmodium vinckei petteri]
MNKGYIKIALALLSVACYMQNIVFASECAPKTKSSNKEPKQQLYIDHKEAKQAANVMAEALSVAKKLAIHTNDYKLYSKKDEGEALYFKRVNNTDIAKLDLTIPNPNNYDSIISMLMDPSAPKNFYNAHVEGAISRIYDPNLVIIKQHYKNNSGPCQRYCHLLAKKTEVRIFCFLHPSRNRNALKMYINLAAFFIKREADCVKVTFIGSIDLNLSPKAKEHAVKKVTASIILDIAKLRDIFKKE